MKLDDRAFARLDKNKDGVLSGKEVNKNVAGMDINGDGSVTREEFGMGRGLKRAEVQMQQGDRNGDGVLSGKELHKSIAGADENKDGRITKSELERFHTRELDRGKLFDGMDGNKDAFLSGKEAETFKDKGWDTDADGRISEAEFLAAQDKLDREARFKDADANADGVLSGNELPADKLAGIDTVKDGRASLPEYLAAPEDLIRGRGEGAGNDPGAEGRNPANGAANRPGSGVRGAGNAAGRGAGNAVGNGATPRNEAGSVAGVPPTREIGGNNVALNDPANRAALQQVLDALRNNALSG
jgi:Ca2+-binding EF-hand superfamily protein